jgi:uncharacterized membrane protein (UPF0182 family)
VEGTGNPYPILQYVLAAFGDRVAFGASLTEALNSLFGAGAGNQAPDSNQSNNSPSPTPSGSASPSPSGSAPSSPAPGSGGGSISPELQSALNQLATAVANLEAAYKTGDVAKIGEAQTAVNQAAAAVAQARGGG